jgi:hypothetical protein
MPAHVSKLAVKLYRVIGWFLAGLDRYSPQRTGQYSLLEEQLRRLFRQILEPGPALELLLGIFHFSLAFSPQTMSFPKEQWVCSFKQRFFGSDIRSAGKNSVRRLQTLKKAAVACLRGKAAVLAAFS